MQIYGNHDLLVYRQKAEELQEKFVREVDGLNQLFSPKFAILKQKVRDRVYIFGLTLCLMIFTIFLVLFGPAKNYGELVIILLVTNSMLILLALVWAMIAIRKQQEAKREWDKIYGQIVPYKTSASEYLAKTRTEVIRTIVLTEFHDELEHAKNEKNARYDSLFRKFLQDKEAELARELGSEASGEDYLMYYDSWGKRITEETTDDYDYLEARRQKAFLISKDKKK